MSDRKFIRELDLLRSKVLHLKLMVESQKAQMLQQQILVIETRKQELLEQIKAGNEFIANKYAIDLATHVVLENTGEVVTKESVPDIKKLMEQLASSTQTVGASTATTSKVEG